MSEEKKPKDYEMLKLGLIALALITIPIGISIGIKYLITNKSKEAGKKTGSDKKA